MIVKVGDEERCVNGGLEMKVTGFNGSKAVCVWSVDGVVRLELFAPADLVKVERGEVDPQKDDWSDKFGYNENDRFFKRIPTF